MRQHNVWCVCALHTHTKRCDAKNGGDPNIQLNVAVYWLFGGIYRRLTNFKNGCPSTQDRNIADSILHFGQCVLYNLVVLFSKHKIFNLLKPTGHVMYQQV